MEVNYPLDKHLIVAFEDGYFPPQTKGYKSKYKTLLVSVVFENSKPKYFKMTLISIDGLDATKKAMEILREVIDRERKRPIVLLGGITFAGFNIIDPLIIHKEYNIPVIVVSKDKPDNDKVKEALIKNFPDWMERYGIIERFSSRASKLIEVCKYGKLYIRVVGLNEFEAKSIISKTQLTGGIPEPLREAKAIASAIARVYFQLLMSDEKK
ncbi:MAG TPA: DUF99 family protein [Desulfurococcales archaeon]|nr:DUF99 family protein [Desulfurococcales archaeon]